PEGGGRGGRHRAGARRRRRDVPPGRDRPLAGCGRRPAEAAFGTRSGRPACGGRGAGTAGAGEGKDGAAMTGVLELGDVSKVYGSGAAEVDALRGVSLSVDGGELVAVMGPSGSGKSTLLTIAGSLEEPTGGRVLVAGTDLSGLSANGQAEMRRRLIGYVFQDFNLLAGLTAVENVT